MLTAAGLEPDLVTYNTMLKCCMRNNLPDKALHLFGELTRQNIPVRPACPAVLGAPTFAQLYVEGRLVCAECISCNGLH